VDRHYVEPVIEIFPKGSEEYLTVKSLVAGRDDPDIDGNAPDTAAPGNLPLLDDLKQFDLKIQGQFGNFIQKDGSLLGDFKEPFLDFVPGTGKGPRFITE